MKISKNRQNPTVLLNFLPKIFNKNLLIKQKFNRA